MNPSIEAQEGHRKDCHIQNEPCLLTRGLRKPKTMASHFWLRIEGNADTFGDTRMRVYPSVYSPGVAHGFPPMVLIGGVPSHFAGYKY